MTNASRYQRYLEDARKRAEQSTDAAEKQAWLRMADKWSKLLALAAEYDLNSKLIGAETLG